MTLDKVVIELISDSVQLILDISTGVPVVLHWGGDLGRDLDANQLTLASRPSVPHAGLDTNENAGVWREHSRGFIGSPALEGHRQGQHWSPMFQIVDVVTSAQSVSITSLDEAAGLELVSTFEITTTGLVIFSQTVRNVGLSVFSVNSLTSWLPLPDQAAEVLDFTGRWVKERQPQRRDIQTGTWSREVREGRSGHDFTIIQLAMSSGANYQHGLVWSFGLQWSGNSRHLVERLPTGRTAIGAGELLLPGEIELAPGDAYAAPNVIAGYSDAGFDGITDRHYRWLRARPNHPTNLRPRPLTLNVWEAVYFDHNLEKLAQLADVAQAIGVERFVLDDGWFGARRNDRRGLGDWVVSPEVWPSGLKPLIDAVQSRGMEFGIWFEGEMVNPDSDLYRDHPEWILKIDGRIPPEGRFQQVLDITHPGAFAHVFSQVDAILSENDISYIKWDHNRTLTDAGHLGRAAVHEQTLAIYRMFDELKSKHPKLEIESCASGGGRIDLGMIEHVDRFWTSDCNDALERQYIQRYTQFAVPPEMLGSHVGPTTSHTTFRTHSLAFRAITALFGHAGIEWDLTETTSEERETLKSWANYYKSNRDLLHSGKMIRVEQSDDTSFVHGVVAHDKSRAIFALVALRAMGGATPSALRLEGLEPKANYRVRLVEPAGPAHYIQRQSPSWLSGVTLTGAALAQVGLQPPILAPENAILLEIQKV